MTLYVSDCRRCGAKKMSFEVYGVSTVFAGAAHTPNMRSNRIELACKCHNCHCSTLFVLEATALLGGQLPKTIFGQNENPVAFCYDEIYSFPLSAVDPTPPDTPEPAATFYHQAVAALAYTERSTMMCFMTKRAQSASETSQGLFWNKHLPFPSKSVV
jgi:hypothetical protein